MHFRCFLPLCLIALVSGSPVQAQSDVGTQDDEQATPVSQTIDVLPGADDQAIEQRLTRILTATGWFDDPEVRVDSGIVFLAGSAVSERQRSWAGELARNTEDVVAVVNNIGVVDPDPWDLRPAWQQLRELWQGFVNRLPLLLLGALLLVATWFIAGWVYRIAERFLSVRGGSRLLRDVLARSLAVIVFVFGLYVVLRVSGLTALAVTIVGGTGLIGLAIGFAFRDIAENFLASILISMQRPFATGDMIAVDGYQGIVQRVNIRATLIMTIDGNHVQVPNARIYKQSIVNYTANPKARECFEIGIGYDDAIGKAQSTALAVLRNHPAVLDDPEPLVLVESLGASTVNLRIYFWIDIATYSQVKVRSAVIRLTKAAFDATGISMPDEAREVVFPAGVPVRMLEETSEAPRQPAGPSVAADETDNATQAEGDLLSDTGDLEKQARQSRLPEGGENLLDS